MSTYSHYMKISLGNIHRYICTGHQTFMHKCYSNSRRTPDSLYTYLNVQCKSPAFISPSSPAQLSGPALLLCDSDSSCMKQLRDQGTNNYIQLIFPPDLHALSSLDPDIKHTVMKSNEWSKVEVNARLKFHWNIHAVNILNMSTFACGITGCN